jgi:hypothetical protein
MQRFTVIYADALQHAVPVLQWRIENFSSNKLSRFSPTAEAGNSAPAA